MSWLLHAAFSHKANGTLMHWIQEKHIGKYKVTHVFSPV